MERELTDPRINEDEKEFEDKEEQETEDTLELFADAREDDDNYVVLHSGEALSVADLDRLLLRRNANLVALVGDQDSGKTTLITAIYDRFCHGTFAGCSFGGSETLVAFDRRNFDSRSVSGRSKPVTVRTSIAEGVHFFHLNLYDGLVVPKRIDIVLSDRAGEGYRLARDKSESVSELVEVEKADVVAFLLDGARMLKPVDRRSAFHSLQQLLRAFLDEGLPNAHAEIQVVLTKFDLISNDSGKAAVVEQVEDFVEKLRRMFGARVSRISLWQVSARDPKRTFHAAWQVDMLLQSWANRTLSARQPQDPAPSSLRTQYDRLLYRTPIEDPDASLHITP